MHPIPCPVLSNFFQSFCDLLSLSAVSLSVGSLEAVRELPSIDGTRQQMWRANNKEGDGQGRGKECAGRPRPRVKMMHGCEDCRTAPENGRVARESRRN